MNNYDFPLGSDVSYAPWNSTEEPLGHRCPDCMSKNTFYAKVKGKLTLICRDYWHKN